MDELISKKELLEDTGISYGQLYRWKRKGLIPDSWFVRKSTFTGQETFFPRQKILDRVQRIKTLKDDSSLDDLAQVFAPDLSSVLLSTDDVIARGLVTPTVAQLFADHFHQTVFAFDKLLAMTVVQELLETGDVSIDEARLALQVITDNYASFVDSECELLLVRRMGVGICLLLPPPRLLCTDQATHIVARISVTESLTKLKEILLEERGSL